MSQILRPLSVNPTWLPPACTPHRCCRGRGYCPDYALMPCFLESQILHLPCNTKVNEPRREKTDFLHMPKQRCRSASP